MTDQESRTHDPSSATALLTAAQTARSTWLTATTQRLTKLPFVTGAWLVGSLGRGTGDAYSDIDVIVAVGPTPPPTLSTDPVHTLGLPGPVLFTRTKPRNAPAGGSYLAICVELAGLPVLVDLYLWPAHTAAVPADAAILYLRAAPAHSELTFMQLLDQHRTADTTGSATDHPSNTLYLIQLAAKYLARGDQDRLRDITRRLGNPAAADVHSLRCHLRQRVDPSKHPQLAAAIAATVRLLDLAETPPTRAQPRPNHSTSDDGRHAPCPLPERR